MILLLIKLSQALEKDLIHFKKVTTVLKLNADKEGQKQTNKKEQILDQG